VARIAGTPAAIVVIIVIVLVVIRGSQQNHATPLCLHLKGIDRSQYHDKDKK
jgi:hypothetical protein